MSADDDMVRERVAVVVFVEAEGVDRRDCHVAAALAVGRALRVASESTHDGTFYVRANDVDQRQALVTGVLTLQEALYGRFLDIEPNDKAFGRLDESRASAAESVEAQGDHR